jgi:hypothetical protein
MTYVYYGENSVHFCAFVGRHPNCVLLNPRFHFDRRRRVRLLVSRANTLSSVVVKCGRLNLFRLYQFLNINKSVG